MALQAPCFTASCLWHCRCIHRSNMVETKVSRGRCMLPMPATCRAFQTASLGCIRSARGHRLSGYCRRWDTVQVDSFRYLSVSRAHLSFANRFDSTACGGHFWTSMVLIRMSSTGPYLGHARLEISGELICLLVCHRILDF